MFERIRAMPAIFRNRTEGGRRLSHRLMSYAGRTGTIVLALPRGGVVTAAEIAEDLEAALDVVVARKLGVPGHEELAMGAIAAGTRILNEDVVRDFQIPAAEIERVTAAEEIEAARRERLYRHGLPPLDPSGKVVIVVDDGVATGATIRAAVLALRNGGAARIVVAVPVAPRETCQLLRLVADEVVCLASPDPFVAVGSWYDDFSPVGDGEVIAILTRLAGRTLA